MNIKKLKITNVDLTLYIQILENKKIIQMTKRNIIILPEYVDRIVNVYSGQKFKKIKITEKMVGTKIGQYCFTRKFCQHKKKSL